jgi:uncharacterized membrane protein (DUF373 family)
MTVTAIQADGTVWCEWFDKSDVLQGRSFLASALLAICRKVIILDLSEIDALHILAFGAVILALGIVYWLMRDSDQSIGDVG